MQDNQLNNTVTFIEIVECKGMAPKSSIMAPKWLWAKAASGADLSEEEIRQCVIVKDFE